MRLGLTLGGGGARGSAHIGALRELFAIGLKPDLITGTSIGGLVGAMLSAGMTLDEIERHLRAFKPSSLYSLPDNEPAIGSAVNIVRTLEEIFAKHFKDRFKDRENERPTFDDLNIPLAVVATDLVTKREVVLDNGDLITALRATMCLPLMFPPVQIGDWHLVDGGVVNNLPFDIARARGATHTIAIDLGNSAPYGTPHENPRPQPDGNLFGIRWAEMLDGGLFDRALYQATREPIWDVATALIDIVNEQNVRLRLAISPPDVLIRPSIGTIGILDFHTIDDGIEAGRQAVRRKANELEPLLTAVAKERKTLKPGLADNTDDT